jgi:hypothetical protein
MNKSKTIFIAIAVVLSPFLIIAIILASRTFTISDIFDKPIDIVDNEDPTNPIDIDDNEDPTDPIDIIDNEDPTDPKVIIGTETLIEALVADEVIHIREDYWSYKIENKYGIVTSDGKIIAAIYDQHFFNGVSDQICSYRNNEFVGYDFDSDLENEIECYGFGWHNEIYYYDTSKKWMFELDGIQLIKANPWFTNNERFEIVQRVILGDGSSEESSDNYSVAEEFSIVRFTKTDTGFSYSFLTDFDYIEILMIFSNEQFKFVVKDKDGKWGLLDNNGGILIEPKYDGFIQPYGEVTLYTVVKNGIYFIIDMNDNVFYESKNSETLSTVKNDKFWIKRDAKWYIVGIEE